MIKKLIIKGKKPFKECHASTVVELDTGIFLVVWFGGSKEGRNDVAIWGAKNQDKEWSEPRLLAKVNKQPHWNPVLFKGSGKELFLYFKEGKNCSHWKTWVMSSTDNGWSWTSPKPLVAGNRGGRGPVKNKCIELSDGTWLAPASSEIGWWKPFVDRSEDKGKTWERSNFVPMDRVLVGKDKKGRDVKFQAIQPSLWESTPGNVHMLLRTSSGKICRSDSSDNGRTWCKIYKTSLPNNNSGIDIVKLSNKKLLLAFNPVGEDWGDRWPLTLALSENNGESWGAMLDIETEPNREYSYPAIISTKDGGAAVTYTWGRENIGFVKLTPSEINSKLKDVLTTY